MTDWDKHIKPGQVLRIAKMIAERGQELDLALGEDETRAGWGIILDDENMMVFNKVEQRGYPGAHKQGARWASRVYPTNWADAETSRWATPEEIPEDVPPEFWPISAQAAINGGV